MKSFFPLELKDKTREIVLEAQGESFSLRSHGAQDIGKYDCLFDLQRMEVVKALLPGCGKGFVVWMGNVPVYWSRPSRTGTMA